MSTEQNPYSPPRADAEIPGAGQPPPAPEQEPRGFRGWLVLPLVALVLTPIQTALVLVGDIVGLSQPGVWTELTTPGSPIYHPLGVPVLAYHLVTYTGQIGFSLLALVRCHQQSRRFPRLMIAWLLIACFLQVVEALLIKLVPAFAASDSSRRTINLVVVLLATALWIPYFVISKRVKNTFVR